MRHNDPMDKIALTGPGGREKLKKLIRDISNDIKYADDKISILEEILGITLDPDLDEKYYQYFTIEATKDGTTVRFRQSSYAVDDGIDALKVEVSTNNGKTWTEITAAPAEDGIPGAILAELDAGEKVLIRGNNEAYGYFYANDEDSVENCNFWADYECYVYGNIMSLIYGDNFARQRKLNKDYAFACFFSDYDDALDHSWVLLKDGEELLLPATILSNYCYSSMFRGCTSLVVAPSLPATTLVYECYRTMFYGCNNLAYIKAMFMTTPSLGYTTAWVDDVKAMGTFVKNSAATWNVSGDNGIPTGWTVETADN